MSESAWLTGLFFSAFTSATLLPGSSEALLAAAIYRYPAAAATACLTATAGNTLGGLLSYWMGRMLPPKELHGRGFLLMQRHGAKLLLLSWVPLIGDALPPAAGWLRLNAWHCFAALLAGKAARYALLTALTLQAV